jgi:hypothetical protein
VKVIQLSIEMSLQRHLALERNVNPVFDARNAIPTIRDVGELLGNLRENVATRAIVYVGDKLAVCEWVNGDPAHAARTIAWIDNSGSARELLNKSYDADVSSDVSVWAALPLRYGPYCSTWVLSEHPKAPVKPGSD